MATFVLVHGGWHAGWCWERLAPLLSRTGNRVVAPDLPAHGADRTPVSERPWERYVPAIEEIVQAQDEPVVLVGHSSGGMIISEVARMIPERIAALVYLAAFLLPQGGSPREMIGPESGSLLTGALRSDPETGTTSIDPSLARDVFYHDCTDADATRAIARLAPEPAIPPGLGDELEPDPPLSVLRMYIETTEDRALPIAVQRAMVRAMPCDAVYTMPTSHSPFLSQPEQLAEILNDVGARYAP